MISKECKELIDELYGYVDYEIVLEDLGERVGGIYRYNTPGKIYVNSNTKRQDSIDITAIHELTHLCQNEYNAGFCIAHYDMKNVRSTNENLRNTLDNDSYYRRSPIEADAYLAAVYYRYKYSLSLIHI